MKQGRDVDATAIPAERGAEDEGIMLMPHGEDSGPKTGVFEYGPGETKAGPVRVDVALVTSVIRSR